MWDVPGSGLGPVSPELAGRVFTADPPARPCGAFFKKNIYLAEMGVSCQLQPAGSFMAACRPSSCVAWTLCIQRIRLTCSKVLGPPAEMEAAASGS